MTDTVLQVRRDAGVVTLRLSRPATLNGLNVQLLAELRAALDAAGTDPVVGAVVLAGAGRGFCSGADLRDGVIPGSPEPAGDDFERVVDSVRTAMECARLLHQMPKPTIAMVGGAAAGAGLALAASCDLRIASTAATFTTSFTRLALPGDFGITYFLTRLLGTAKARELMYLSERIDATEALRIGLVNRVVAADQLEATTTALAAQLGNGPRTALRCMKRNLNAAEEGSLEQLMDLEVLHTARTLMSEDHREAVRAFLEKRPPQFKRQ